MSSFFQNFLGKLKAAVQVEPIVKDEVSSLRRITEELDHLDANLAKYLAAFAFILYRVAYADQQVSQAEARAIEVALQRWGHLTESQAVLVAELAKTQNRIFGGTDNFLVTREFREFTTAEQRADLLNCLFAVAASDEVISNEESDVVRLISRELGFEHAEFIAARSAFRDKLGALK